MGLNYVLLGFMVEYIFPDCKWQVYPFLLYTNLFMGDCDASAKAHSFLFAPQSVSWGKPILSSTDKHPCPTIWFWWLLLHTNTVQVI